MRIGIVALHLPWTRIRQEALNHSRFRLHDDEVVTEIDTPVVEELIAYAEADDVTVTGRKHGRTMSLTRRIPIVGVTDTTGEVLCEIIFKAE